MNMNERPKLTVEIDPELPTSQPLSEAIQAASRHLEEGLARVDNASKTRTIQPKLRWEMNTDDEQRLTLRMVYNEEADGTRKGLQSTQKRVPISQMLDGVGRRYWVFHLLESVGRHRTKYLIAELERKIMEQEEAERHAG
jgi:hypothetical protein